MTIDDLMSYKNVICAEYERAKDTRSSKLPSLTFQMASLEESIAEEHVKAGNPEQAVVYYVSQGSYLFELGRISEGKAAWERAKSLTTKEKVKTWVDEGLKQYAQT